MSVNFEKKSLKSRFAKKPKPEINITTNNYGRLYDNSKILSKLKDRFKVKNPKKLDKKRSRFMSPQARDLNTIFIMPEF